MLITPNDHTNSSSDETVPLRVAIWNCQGIRNNQHNITSLLTLEPPPDIVLLSKTWTRRGTISEDFRKLCTTHGYSLHVSSTPKLASGRGRPKGGTAVLISTTWAHPSTVKQWKGPAVPGYLDGVEIDTDGGGSLTILAAYVPPTYSDLKHAPLIRETIVAATTQIVRPTIVGGDFNGARRGERDGDCTQGDSLHNNMIRASGLRSFNADTRRAGPCFAGDTLIGSRIDDLLVGTGVQPPDAEEALSNCDFLTASVHSHAFNLFAAIPSQSSPAG